MRCKLNLKFNFLFFNSFSYLRKLSLSLSQMWKSIKLDFSCIFPFLLSERDEGTMESDESGCGIGKLISDSWIFKEV